MQNIKFKMGEHQISGSNIFSGRDKGVEVRKKLNLDRVEDENDKIYLMFPNDTWGINPSFFGGLLETSIKKNKDIFWEKYIFTYYDESELNESLKADLKEDFQFVLNSMEE